MTPQFTIHFKYLITSINNRYYFTKYGRFVNFYNGVFLRRAYQKAFRVQFFGLLLFHQFAFVYMILISVFLNALEVESYTFSI